MTNLHHELTVELVSASIIKHATAIFETDVSLEHGFLDLGGDSVHAIELLFRLEEELDVNIDPRLLYEIDDFEALATVIVDLVRIGGN